MVSEFNFVIYTCDRKKTDSSKYNEKIFISIINQQ